MEGDLPTWNAVQTIVVSIHAPRMEGDDAWANGLNVPLVSIHASRMEGDIRNRADLI